MITVCGANIDRAGLHRIPVVRPRHAGRYWQGIQHGELVDTIISEAESRDWEILDSRFAVAGDGADLAGALWLKTPEVNAPQGQTLSLGMLTSNRMTRKLRLYVGTVIAVCNNGMATGDLLMNRRHTHRLELRDEIRRSLDEYVTKARQIGEISDRLRDRQLSDNEWSRILVEAGRRRIMAWSRLGQVDEEYREPRHDEHGRGTSWTGLQAFTEIVKKDPPLRQMDSQNRFRQLLPVASRDLTIVA